MLSFFFHFEDFKNVSAFSCRPSYRQRPQRPPILYNHCLFTYCSVLAIAVLSCVVQELLSSIDEKELCCGCGVLILLLRQGRSLYERSFVASWREKAAVPQKTTQSTKAQLHPSQSSYHKHPLPHLPTSSLTSSSSYVLLFPSSLNQLPRNFSSCIALYSTHLCPASEIPQSSWRLGQNPAILKDLDPF